MQHKLPADLDALTKPREPSSAVIVTCKNCCQRFNLSDLTEAYHHGPEPHEPLFLSSDSGLLALRVHSPNAVRVA
jgi:hypothetical protein